MQVNIKTTVNTEIEFVVGGPLTPAVMTEIVGEAVRNNIPLDAPLVNSGHGRFTIRYSA